MKAKRKALIVISLAVLLLVAAAGGLIFAKEKNAEETIKEGIFIGGVDVSGMNTEQAKKAVAELAAEISSASVTFVIGENEVKAPVSALGLFYHESDVIDRAFAIGKKGNVVSRYMESRKLKEEGEMLEPDYGFDEKMVRNFLQKKCTVYDVKAVDAGLARNGNSFQVTEGKVGYGLNLEKSLKAVMDYLNKGWHGKEARINLVTDVIEAKGNKNELQKIKDLLGTATTSYKTSSASRSGNIQRGAGLINGRVLYPGEEFSAYEAISPISVENGYFMAPSYEQGKVVETAGGGICQISSTLYNAVLKAELEVTQRSCHSMIVSYVDPSMDAAISGTYKDFKFKNNTNAPVFIEAVTAGKQLTFNIYGAETRSKTRKVEYQSEVVSETEPTTILTATEDRFGSIVTTQNEHKGVVAKLWKIIYENGTEVSRKEVNKSTYSMAPKYVSVGTAEASPEAAAELQAAIEANDEEAAKAVVAKYGTVNESDEVPVDADAASESVQQQGQEAPTATAAPQENEAPAEAPQEGQEAPAA